VEGEKAGYSRRRKKTRNIEEGGLPTKAAGVQKTGHSRKTDGETEDITHESLGKKRNVGEKKGEDVNRLLGFLGGPAKTANL